MHLNTKGRRDMAYYILSNGGKWAQKGYEREAEDEVNTEMLETSELSKQYIRIFLHCS